MKTYILTYQGIFNEHSTSYYLYIEPNGEQHRFTDILFPYQVIGSTIKGRFRKYQAGIGRFNHHQLIENTPTNRNQEERIFALTDYTGKFFLLLDPINNTYTRTTKVGLLKIWDLHYPNLESYFQKLNWPIQYLTEKEIQKLTV